MQKMDFMIKDVEQNNLESFEAYLKEHHSLHAENPDFTFYKTAIEAHRYL